MGDNLLPLLAQIVLDAYLSKEFLYLPRKLLVYNDQIDVMTLFTKGHSKALPHMALIGKLMSGGGVTMKEVHFHPLACMI